MVVSGIDKSIATAPGLPPNERALVKDLLDVWEKKLTRNRLRERYYEGKNPLKNLGIAIPRELERIDTVCGWPAKAVDILANRSIFEGFVFSDGGQNSDLERVLKENNFDRAYAQLVQSELVSSCAFMTVSKGDAGEPGVIISTYSATQAAALWDYRRKRIKAGIAIVDTKTSASGTTTVTQVNLYTDSATWEITKGDAGWTVIEHRHGLGRPLMEPFVFKPSLKRPFGKSRITRAVMAITDSAMRTSLRSEIAAEFNAAPQKYILGIKDENSFFDGTSEWDAAISRILAITVTDDDDTVPTVGQFAQGSMTQHLDHLRSLAAQFSGETSVPISSLGVIHDNPSSAEAIYAAKEDLVIEANDLNASNGTALRNVGIMALCILGDTTPDQLDDVALSIEPRFKNPAMPSIVSQADAVVKMVTAIPALAESEVVLEELGFSAEQITRINAARAKAAYRNALMGVANG